MRSPVDCTEIFISPINGDMNNIIIKDTNTLIGENAQSSSSIYNSTAIGSGSNVSGSSSIVLGDGTCNVGLNESNPSYGVHLGGENAPFTPQIYLTGLASQLSNPISSTNDLVLYAYNGALYYQTIGHTYSVNVTEMPIIPSNAGAYLSFSKSTWDWLRKIKKKLVSKITNSRKC